MLDVNTRITNRSDYKCTKNQKYLNCKQYSDIKMIK